MTLNGFVQLGLYLIVLLGLAKPLGTYMARVYDGQRTPLDRLVGPLERLIYRLCGVRPEESMPWKTYAVAMLLFNALGMFAVYALQRVQGWLPLNPQGFAGVTPDSSFNTAASCPKVELPATARRSLDASASSRNTISALPVRPS